MASDGGKIGYLLEAKRYQRLDPELFAKLHEWVIARRTRRVSLMEHSDLIPGAKYHGCFVPESRCDRGGYLAQMSGEFEHSHLILFDPDSGLEVPSKPYKGKPSRHHLYFHKLRSAFEVGHSILAIQFFPRRKRDEYIEARTQEFQRHLGIRPLCVRTANVAYSLAMREPHAEILTARLQSACLKWSPEINLAP